MFKMMMEFVSKSTSYTIVYFLKVISLIFLFSKYNDFLNLYGKRGKFLIYSNKSFLNFFEADNLSFAMYSKIELKFISNFLSSLICIF